MFEKVRLTMHFFSCNIVLVDFPGFAFKAHRRETLDVLAHAVLEVLRSRFID